MRTSKSTRWIGNSEKTKRRNFMTWITENGHNVEAVCHKPEG